MPRRIPPPRTPLRRARSRARSPRGSTLPELLAVLTLAAIAAGLAVRAGGRVMDAAAVRAAGVEVRSAFATARALAVRRGERAAVRLDTAAGAVAVHVRADTALRRSLRLLYQVRVAATRDSAAYGATGLGFGGANLRLVVRRGAAAETVWVSRLGRVR